MRQSRQRSEIFRQRRSRFVSALRLDQPQLLNVSRKRGLRHAQALRRQPPPQFFLIADGAIAHQFLHKVKTVLEEWNENIL